MTTVPTLHVRNVPPDLYEYLRERAARDGRSINAIVIGLIEESAAQRTRHDEVMEGLRRMANRLGPPPPGSPHAADVIRQGRDERERRFRR